MLALAAKIKGRRVDKESRVMNEECIGACTSVYAGMSSGSSKGGRGMRKRRYSTVQARVVVVSVSVAGFNVVCFCYDDFTDHPHYSQPQQRQSIWTNDALHFLRVLI